jgi:hypothetical protein
MATYQLMATCEGTGQDGSDRLVVDLSCFVAYPFWSDCGAAVGQQIFPVFDSWFLGLNGF